MVEDLEELQNEYKDSIIYFQNLEKATHQYLNDIESLKSAMIDFLKYCDQIKTENKSNFEFRKKYAEKNEEMNWMYYNNIITKLKGTHYFSYIKTHIKAFEGMSKTFITKIDNIK